jgi:hypothetical protein
VRYASVTATGGQSASRHAWWLPGRDRVQRRFALGYVAIRPLPVACEPSSFASAEAFAHHLAEGRRLLAGGLEREELTDGWAVRLPNDDETMLSVARWTVDERRCCPFFTFVIEREPAPGALWIRVSGPGSATGVMEEAFTKTGP